MVSYISLHEHLCCCYFVHLLLLLMVFHQLAPGAAEGAQPLVWGLADLRGPPSVAAGAGCCGYFMCGGVPGLVITLSLPEISIWISFSRSFFHWL